MQQGNGLGKRGWQSSWADQATLAHTRGAGPSTGLALQLCSRGGEQLGGTQNEQATRESSWSQPSKPSRGAQQLGGIGRLRLRQQHEGGARQRVERVQVKGVRLQQLAREGKREKQQVWGAAAVDGKVAAAAAHGHAAGCSFPPASLLSTGLPTANSSTMYTGSLPPPLAWMPLLSGMGDSCAEMPHMPNLQRRNECET